MIRRLRILPIPVLIAAIVPPFALAAVLTVTSTKLTVSVAASTVPISSCTLNSTADGWAQTGALASTDGTGATLSVRSDALGARRSFVDFNLASCVPLDAEIKTAELRLFMSTAPGSSRTYEAQRINASWGEGSINYGIATAGTAVERVTGTTNNVTLTWNVKPDVEAFAGGTPDTDNGWRIMDQNDGNLTAITGTFHSREGANDPQLVITYYP